jgi:N-acetylmuramoyl-L-alanine amidase
MRQRTRTSHIVLHTFAFKGKADAAEVKKWHLQRGFSDIGYHWVIRRDGKLEKGRDEWRVGAHCRDGGYNNKAIGISFEGHGDFQPWTVLQLTRLIVLYKDINTRYSIPVENVIGHRESGAKKTCPGRLINMVHVRKLLSVST